MEDRKLMEIAQFVVNRKTENIRDELHEYLVEVALYDIDHSIRKGEITNWIKNKFGFLDFPQQLVDSSIFRLRKRKKISVEVEGYISKYRLHQSRKQEIQNMISQHKVLSEYFTNTILNTIINKVDSVSDDEKKIIVQSLFGFLGRAFSELSLKIAAVITKSAFQPQRLDELLFSEKEILDKSFSNISKKDLREATTDAVKKVFAKLDGKVSLFLYSISQSYILLQILNIDPECQALQKEIFLSDMTAYFDTNIVIDLFCETSRQRRFFHSTAVRLVGLMRTLGIKIHLTKKTVEELKRRLSLSDEIYEREMRGMSRKKRNKVLEYINDPFIEEYSQQLRRNPSLRWKGFIGRMRRFTSILERKYGLTLDKSDYREILTQSEFQEVSTLVSEANPDKPKGLVQHDCFHLLLIDMLRSGVRQESLVPKYWFVTRDKTICLAEQMRLIIEKGKGLEKRPSSVFISVWINMISPFLSPKVATQEASKLFADTFSSDFIPSFPKMSPKILTNVLRPLLDQKDLDSEQIRAIVTDIYLAEHFTQMLRTGELPFYINKKLMKLQEEKHKKELKRIDAEKEALNLQIQQSSQQNVKLTTKLEQRKQFERYLAGALIFFLVWAFTYLVILLPTVREPIQASFWAVIIALIVGYLLGFQRFDWIIEKVLSRVSPSK